jgi:alkanesulfonate monooxygenase SsuD/methylene tetrahydromethanopterin reductase-like flavin-dependent oxidoreductase (luciferase family)
LQIITHLLQNPNLLDFEGVFYQIYEGCLLPRPTRPGGPPILIGGNGPQRTLPLVARFAQEWNAVFIPPQEIRERNQQLDTLLQKVDRDPHEVRRSLMTGCIFGKNQTDLKRAIKQRTNGKRSAKELVQRGLVAGTANQIVDQLGAIQAAGMQRVMLQWLDLDDLDGLESLATGILPQIK